jgi:hypothetical protein
VLVVAGGKGRLAFELWVRRGVATTIVDPEPRGRESKKMKRERAAMGRQQPCPYIAEPFHAHFRPDLVQRSSLLCGMHPDEATEAIVDAALLYGRPFAVVPCCVFPTLFPGRTLDDGTPVVHTQQFALYLANKDTRK